MNEKIVIDSSALLALILRESGFEKVLEYTPHCLISAINFSEVIIVLLRDGMSLEEAREITSALVHRVEPFGEEQALMTAALRAATLSKGLSLGDRACLALAKTHQARVLTADKVWSQLKLGLDITVIR